MCGISGLARIDGGTLPPGSEQVLRRMADALAHRGPDDEQVLCDGVSARAGLAFTRLALVDPEGGRQPFVTRDGDVTLVCNGEIYNHRELAASLPAGALRSRSDCEVLLPLYLRDGLGFLDRVRGMFAIAIYDARSEQLVLARDRLGLKPLFYTRNAEVIAFASEIKALFAHPGCPRRLDWDAALADQSLTAAPVFTDEPPTTWFEGIEHVEAATVVRIDLRDGATSAHRYWRMPEPADDFPEHPHRMYLDLLASSVSECLTADAEIGLLLSGGVDSALIAALAAGSGVHTFTALHASTLTGGDATYGCRLAADLGLPNHQVIVGRTPSAEEWKRLLWLTEMPQCGPEQFFKYELYRYAHQDRPLLKGMMLGGGSDELSGGYTGQLAMGGGWEDFLATARNMNLRRSLAGRPGLAAWWDHFERPLLREETLGPPADPYDAFLAWKCREMQQNNFWHEDRTAAGNAIEARVPFLDHRLVELMAAVPRRLRRALLWDKRLVRHAAAEVLPRYVTERPKVAFYEGEGRHHAHRAFVSMLARDGGALLEEALSAPGAWRVDAGNARAYLAALLANPRAGHVELLLRVVNLGLLELMATDPPGSVMVGEGAPLRAVRTRAWQDLARCLPAEEEMPEDAVPLLADGVMLVAGADGTSYVVMDGSLEYELEDEAWERFLYATDGRLTIGELAVAADRKPAELRPLISEALTLGVLTLRTPR
ncbi:asparagine synthase (glutamine-hydrolyzing) [Nonomuraea sp. NPDC050404]|uniref:asparagine synthase (glutamine-hydrolyzing) n=1 Tax=Nonomuraea sp. NPDC050404 TaxID=3155783 RepID=UPI0034059FF8